VLAKQVDWTDRKRIHVNAMVMKYFDVTITPLLVSFSGFIFSLLFSRRQKPCCDFFTTRLLLVEQNKKSRVPHTLLAFRRPGYLEETL
jgi:hypothetical protein